MMNEGMFTVANAPFDPNEVFETVCETFTPLVEAKKIKLTFSVE